MINNKIFGKTNYCSREANRQYRSYTPSCKEIKEHFRASRKELESVTKCLLLDDKKSETVEEANNYLFRSQIIMVYSAFDLFMHEMLYLGFEEMRQGKLEKSKDFIDKFCNPPILDDSLYNQYTKVLKRSYGKETLTSSFCLMTLEWLGFDREDASKFILNNSRDSYMDNRGKIIRPSEFLTNQLNRKAERRNKLVHAYDYTIPGGVQESINKATAFEYVSYITNIVERVFIYVTKRWE